MTNDVKPSNPKDQVGVTKVPLHLCSPIASAHWALAQFAGMAKYQAWNWRAAGVRASVYVAALKRHIDAYNGGERLDPVDGTHHLGNIMACAAILLDAEAANMLTDDRPPIVDFRPTYAEVEAQMPKIRERYSHIPQNPYTLLNTFVKGQRAAPGTLFNVPSAGPKPEFPANVKSDAVGREAC